VATVEPSQAQYCRFPQLKTTVAKWRLSGGSASIAPSSVLAGVPVGLRSRGTVVATSVGVLGDAGAGGLLLLV